MNRNTGIGAYDSVDHEGFAAPSAATPDRGIGHVGESLSQAVMNRVRDGRTATERGEQS